MKEDGLKKLLLAVGLLLLVFTLALNEQVLNQLFSVRLHAVATRLKVWVFVIDLLFALVIVFVLAWRSSKKKLLIDLFVGIGFTLVLLAGIEGLFYYFNSIRPLDDSATFHPIEAEEGGQIEAQDSQTFIQPDDWLGYKLVPNTQISASREKAGELLYDVIYSTDDWGRRVTPTGELDSSDPFILFFGGSFTFGDGVNDDETMPYYVSQLAPEYRVYNYGGPGYGPQQMLAKLQSEEIIAEIDHTQAEGILIYTFIRQHIGRVIGSMWIHNQRGDRMPYYYLDPDGRLIRKGNFVSGRPTLSVLYGIADKSQTLEYFGVSFPLSVSDHDLRITAKIIEESRDLFREKFNSNRFYVLIYPTLGITEFLPYLEEANISYLDYSDLAEAQDSDFWLGEGHPTAKGHKMVAEQLVHDLGLAH